MVLSWYSGDFQVVLREHLQNESTPQRTDRHGLALLRRWAQEDTSVVAGVREARHGTLLVRWLHDVVMSCGTHVFAIVA